MSDRFDKMVSKDIVEEVGDIRTNFPELLDKKIDVILECSKEKLIELLNTKWIDETFVDFVASEDDIEVIKRVIKLNNRNIPFSRGLITFARNEKKADILSKTCDCIFASDAYELYNGLMISQMEEVLEALKSGIKLDKITRYMIGLDVEQMCQMRKAIKASLCPEKLSYLYSLAKSGMPSTQLREIRKCAESGRWSNADIKWLVNKNLSSEQLSCVRKSAERIGWEEIKFMANPEFEIKKLECIGKAFKAGVSIEIVRDCSTYDYRTCRDRLLEEQKCMLSEII